MRRLITAAVAAFSTSYAKAAVGAGALGASMATLANLDPIPWGISVFGAFVVTFKFPATRRADGWANAIISVFLGGLGCEFMSTYVAKLTGITPGPWLCALALSTAWPAAVAAIVQLWLSWRSRYEKKSEGR